MSDINIPDNNGGMYRIPGEDAQPVAEEPILTSEAFEIFKELRMDMNKILVQNKQAFKELAIMAPEGSVKNPEVLALLVLLAKRVYNADTDIKRA